MHLRPTNAVEALSFLLQDWVDQACPVNNRDVATLNHLWLRLAVGLCGHDASKKSLFEEEIAKLRPTAKAGEPPVHALEQRLYELINAGLQDYFLVIAVRQALDQLISAQLPSASPQWMRLADAALPLQLRFAAKPDEVRGPGTTPDA